MISRLFFIAALAFTIMCSCSGNKAQEGNTTLCQFDNIRQERMTQYTDPDMEGTFYTDNKIAIFWPTMVNGKACPALQQALLQAITDSAELNTIELVTDYLLKPNQYLEIDSAAFKAVDSIPDTSADNITASELTLRLQEMGDRLMTWHISTYDFMARAAHGVYSNRYVTYDLQTSKAVSLTDLVADTTLLREVILKSIKQTYDYGVDDLFIPDNGLLPLPRDFFIDGSVLHAVYQVYDIASYAQGAIDAPIYPYMLKPEEIKRLYTPYGLELTENGE